MRPRSARSSSVGFSGEWQRRVVGSRARPSARPCPSPRGAFVVVPCRWRFHHLQSWAAAGVQSRQQANRRQDLRQTARASERAGKRAFLTSPTRAARYSLHPPVRYYWGPHLSPQKPPDFPGRDLRHILLPHCRYPSIFTSVYYCPVALPRAPRNIGRAVGGSPLDSMQDIKQPLRER